MQGPVKLVLCLTILCVNCQDLLERTDSSAKSEGLRKKQWVPPKPHDADIQEGVATVETREEYEDNAVVITPTPGESEKGTFGTSGEEETSGPVQIVRALLNVTKETGENVKMRCEVRSSVEPVIIWYKNEAPLEPEKGKVEMRKYRSEDDLFGSRLRIVDLDTHDTGYYKCEASLDQHKVETSGILKVRAGRVQPPATIPNFPPLYPHFPALGGKTSDRRKMVFPCRDEIFPLPGRHNNNPPS